MKSYLNPPLVPRNGTALLVLIIARISTLHQDEKSLDDQVALCRNWLIEHTNLPSELTPISSRGSGEYLDRIESAKAIELIESRRYDLIITEDLGRIYRRIEALNFCEFCADFDTRLVAINDQVDTAQDNWRLSAFFGVLRHEAYNKDTSARIRRTLRNRFSQGGVIQTLPYGYEKPEGCKDDSLLRKLPEAEQVYDRWFTMLEEGASFAEIADRLNAEGIPTGPYCRSERWTSSMVGRITANPILKGVRVRNNKMAKRINKTGRRRSVDAPPEERLERNCPNLAFLDPDRFDRVNRIVAEKNGKYKRNGDGSGDPRRGVSKKRTPWPGQHVLCGVCGRLYYRGGHGKTDHLMCSGSREHKCWNGATFDGPWAAGKLADAILAEIESLPEFESTFLADLRREMNAQESERSARLRELDGRQKTLIRGKENILEAIRQSGSKSYLIEEGDRLQAELDRLARDREELVRSNGVVVALPSIERIKTAARQAFADLAIDSPEFSRYLRRLISRFFVKPYQLIDGGEVVLRAHLTLNLASIVDASTHGNAYGTLLERELIVDLFTPPQRVEHLKAVSEMTAQHIKQRDIGAALGITQTAVQRSLALARQIEKLGLSDPYQLVTEPPSESGRLRRHLHPRYGFEPLEGFPRF